MVSSTGLTSAAAFTECFSSGKEQQQGLPQLTSWIWNSIRRAFKNGRLCTEYKHLSGAFQLQLAHNLQTWPWRRGDKLLVSQPCPASLTEHPRLFQIFNGINSQPLTLTVQQRDLSSAPSELPPPQCDHHWPLCLGSEADAGEGIFQWLFSLKSVLLCVLLQEGSIRESCLMLGKDDGKCLMLPSLQGCSFRHCTVEMLCSLHKGALFLWQRLLLCQRNLFNTTTLFVQLLHP